MKFMSRVRIYGLLCSLLAALLPGSNVMASDNAVALAEVLRAERVHFGKTCRSINLADDYLTLIDYNNDKLLDVVTKPGGVTCDGVSAPECSVLGCETRFYTQLKDGTYHLTAEMQLYDWHMRLRYGNMIFVMTMQGGMCDRAAVDVCTVEYRVRSLRFVELKRE